MRLVWRFRRLPTCERPQGTRPVRAKPSFAPATDLQRGNRPCGPSEPAHRFRHSLLFSPESLRQTHSGKGLPSLSLQFLRLSASIEHPLKAVVAIIKRVPKRNIKKSLKLTSSWLDTRCLSCQLNGNSLIQDVAPMTDTQCQRNLQQPLETCWLSKVQRQSKLNAWCGHGKQEACRVPHNLGAADQYRETNRFDSKDHRRAGQAIKTPPGDGGGRLSSREANSLKVL